MRPLLLFATVVAALLFVACQPPARGGDVQSRAGVSGSGKRPWLTRWQRPPIPEDLPRVDATAHALVEVVEALPYDAQEALLAPWYAHGPAPTVGSLWAPDALLEISQWRGNAVDVVGLLGALEDALGSTELAVAAIFVGPEPLARARSRRALRRLPPERLTYARLRPYLRRSERERLSWAEQALSLAALRSLQWPVERSYRVTSGFGPRIHPVSGASRAHRGVDIAVPEGTVIRAPADGVVRVVAHGRVNGKWVEVDHGSGVRTQYVHLSEIWVKRQQKVEAGEVLGLSGATGRVTGPHLHYQLKHQGRAVDPMSYRMSQSAVRRRVPRPTAPAVAGTQTAMP